jgi:hypothetical protein
LSKGGSKVIPSFLHLECSSFSTRKRCWRSSDKIRRKINNKNLAFENIPDPPPFTTDEQFNKAVDCIRSFELNMEKFLILTVALQ